MDKQTRQELAADREVPPSYMVSIYVAAPGTPLLDGTKVIGTSGPGHMYYTVSDGKTVNGYGFAPIKHEMFGLGVVSTDDRDRYKDPLYRRDLEITKEQYETLKSFGENALRGGESDFSLYYSVSENSCVDFVWNGLNEAKMYTRDGLFSTLDRQDIRDVGHEGSLKPTQNVDDVRGINPPVPGSPLNREQSNPMPDRTPFQRFILSEESGGSPAIPGHPDYNTLQQIRGHVHGLDEASGRPFDQRSEQLSHSLLTLAKDNGMTRVDHVVYSRAEGRHAAGEDVFVVEGRLNDPTHRRASISTEVAAQTPVEASNAQLEVVNERVAREQGQQASMAQQVSQQATDRENPHVMRG